MARRRGDENLVIGVIADVSELRKEITQQFEAIGKDSNITKGFSNLIDQSLKPSRDEFKRIGKELDTINKKLVSADSTEWKKMAETVKVLQAEMESIKNVLDKFANKISEISKLSGSDEMLSQRKVLSLTSQAVQDLTKNYSELISTMQGLQKQVDSPLKQQLTALKEYQELNQKIIEGQEGQIKFAKERNKRMYSEDMGLKKLMSVYDPLKNSEGEVLNQSIETEGEINERLKKQVEQFLQNLEPYVKDMQDLRQKFTEELNKYNQLDFGGAPSEQLDKQREVVAKMAEEILGIEAAINEIFTEDSSGRLSQQSMWENRFKDDFTFEDAEGFIEDQIGEFEKKGRELAQRIEQVETELEQSTNGTAKGLVLGFGEDGIKVKVAVDTDPAPLIATTKELIQKVTDAVKSTPIKISLQTDEKTDKALSRYTKYVRELGKLDPDTQVMGVQGVTNNFFSNENKSLVDFSKSIQGSLSEIQKTTLILAQSVNALGQSDIWSLGSTLLPKFQEVIASIVVGIQQAKNAIEQTNWEKVQSAYKAILDANGRMLQGKAGAQAKEAFGYQWLNYLESGGARSLEDVVGDSVKTKKARADRVDRLQKVTQDLQGIETKTVSTTAQIGALIKGLERIENLLSSIKTIAEELFNDEKIDRLVNAIGEVGKNNHLSDLSNIFPNKERIENLITAVEEINDTFLILSSTNIEEIAQQIERAFSTETLTNFINALNTINEGLGRTAVALENIQQKGVRSRGSQKTDEEKARIKAQKEAAISVFQYAKEREKIETRIAKVTNRINAENAKLYGRTWATTKGHLVPNDNAEYRELASRRNELNNIINGIFDRMLQAATDTDDPAFLEAYDRLQMQLNTVVTEGEKERTLIAAKGAADRSKIYRTNARTISKLYQDTEENAQKVEETFNNVSSVDSTKQVAEWSRVVAKNEERVHQLLKEYNQLTIGNVGQQNIDRIKGVKEELEKLGVDLDRLYANKDKYHLDENILINDQNVQTLEDFHQETERVLSGLNVLSGGFDATGKKWSGTIQTINGETKDLTLTWDEFAKVVRMTDVSKPAGDINYLGLTLKNVEGTLKSAARMFIGVNGALRLIRQSFSQGVAAVKEYDAALTNISYTMNLSKSQLNDLGQATVEMARNLNLSVKDAMAISQIYANMNTTSEEILRIAQPTAVLANLTGAGTETAANQIQSVMQQFDMLDEEADHIVDTYDKISASIKMDYAKGVKSIADGVKAAGEVAHDAGMTFEQLAAVIAKTIERTREEGSAIGQALKTIVVRTSKASKLSGADEVDVETLSEASKALHAVGIDVYTTSGEFRNIIDILGELSAKWDTLTDAQRAQISFAVAATRQTNKFKAILNAFTDSMVLAEQATNAQGNAMANQEKYAQSLGGLLQSISTEAETFWIKLIDSDTVKFVLTAIRDIIKGLNDLSDTIGAFPTALGVGGGLLFGSGVLKTLFGTKNPKLLNGLGNAKTGLSGLGAIGGVSEIVGNIMKTPASAWDAQGGTIAQVRALGDAIINLDKNQAELVLSSQGLSEAMKQNAFAMANNLRQTEGYTQEAAVTSQVIKGLGLSFKAMLPYLAVTAGVTAAVAGIVLLYNHYKKLEEIRKRSIDNAKKEAEQIKNNAASTEDYLKTVKKLSDELKDQNITEYERQQKKIELLDIQNKLVETYGDEAEKLDLINGKYEEQIKLLKELNSKQWAQWRSTVQENGKTNIQIAEEAVAGLSTPYTSGNFITGFLDNFANLQIESPYVARIIQDAFTKAGFEFSIDSQGIGDISEVLGRNSAEVSQALSNVVDELYAERDSLSEDQKELFDQYVNPIKADADDLAAQTDSLMQQVRLLIESNPNEDIRNLAGEAETIAQEAIRAFGGGSLEAMEDALEKTEEFSSSINSAIESASDTALANALRLLGGEFSSHVGEEAGRGLAEFLVHNKELVQILQDTGITASRIKSGEGADAYYSSAIRKLIEKEFNALVNNPYFNYSTRKYIDPAKMTAAGWGQFDANDYVNMFTSTEEAGRWTINISPILPNGEVLDEQGLYNYIDNLDTSHGLEELFASDTQHIILHALEGTWEETKDQWETWQRSIDQIKDRDADYFDSYKSGQEALNGLRSAAIEAGIDFDELYDVLVKIDAVVNNLNDKNKIGAFEALENINMSDAVTAVDNIQKVADSITDLIINLTGEEGSLKNGINNAGLKSIYDLFSAEGTQLSSLDTWMAKLDSVRDNAGETAKVLVDMVETWASESEKLGESSGDVFDYLKNGLEDAGITFTNLGKEVLDSGINYTQAVNQVARSGINLENATQKDIDSLSGLIVQFENATEAQKNYFIQKMMDAGVIDVSGDIEGLNRIITALGLSTNAWIAYYRARAQMDAIGAMSVERLSSQLNGGAGADEGALGFSGSGAAYKQALLKDTQRAVDASKKALEAQFKDLMNFDPTRNSTYEAKAGSGSGGGGSDRAKEAEKESKAMIDWYQRVIDKLNEQHELEQKVAEDSNQTYSMRQAAIQRMIDLDNQLIKVLKDQDSGYQQKYNKAIEELRNLTDDEGKALVDINDQLKDAEGKLISIEELQRLIEASSPSLSLMDFGEEANTALTEIINLYEQHLEIIKKVGEQEEENFKHWREQYDLRIQELEEYLTLRNGEAETLEKEIELTQALGGQVVEAQYQRLITNSKRQQSLYEEQIDTYRKMLGELHEGDEAYNNIVASIRECANAIIDCEIKQAEWNEAIKNIPIGRLSQYLAMLENIKTDILNFMSEQDAYGIIHSVEQYEQLMEISRQTLEKSLEQQELLAEKIANYEFGSDKYEETANEIQNIDNNISAVLQSMGEWSSAILHLPIERISEVNETLQLVISSLNELSSRYDQVISAVTGSIDLEIKAIQKEREETEKLYEERIKGIQDIIDALEEENEARQKINSVEQAQYDLERANTQKTIAVIRDGQRVFEADQEAIRNAQEELDQAQYEYKVWQLEREIKELEEERDRLLETYDLRIEALEEISSKWEEITDNIAHAKDMLAADEFLGGSWLEKVLTGNDQDIFESFNNLYKVLDANRTSYEEQVASNERIATLMEQYVKDYMDGSKGYEEAFVGITRLTEAVESGLSAADNLTEVQALLGNDSLPDVLADMRDVVQMEAANYGHYFSVVESNTIAIQDYTQSWDELKASIDEQLKALEEAYHAAARVANEVHRFAQALSYYESSDDDYSGDSRGYNGPVTYGGGSYAPDAPVTTSYSELMEWIEEHKHHNGIEGGAIKTGQNDRMKMLQAMALRPLKPNEVPAILKAGEAVLTQGQQTMLLSNMKRLGMHDGLSMRNGAPIVNLTMGNLTFHEINNGQDFANFITKNLSNAVAQSMAKAM